MPRGKDRPSIKDDRRYEALREQGMSKEKAARIANSDPKEMARNRRNPGESYDEWSVSELRKRASEVGVRGRSSMNKRELVSALRKGD